MCTRRRTARNAPAPLSAQLAEFVWRLVVRHVRADGGEGIRGARPYPNVDIYTASVYHRCGIQTDLLTPVLLMSRMAGWTAHVMEHRADNRLIRPYRQDAGERGPKWVPLVAR